MAYWWVSQGDTFANSRQDGVLWAPAPDTDDTFHWRNLDLVAAGDVCLCYRNKRFLAIAVAQSARLFAPRPIGWPSKSNWTGNGRLIPVTYSDFSEPINLDDLPANLRRSLSAPTVKYGPLDSALNANQGYMFPVSTEFGEELLRLAGIASDDTTIDRAITDSVASPTERQAVSKARIGQGQFRDDLMSYWKGQCAVTGLTLKTLLRASHVKPWRSSNNKERLDPFNGLLLSPTYDAAFDKFLITFDNDGSIRIANSLDNDTLQCLSIDEHATVHFVEKHIPYLDHHRTLFHAAQDMKG